MKNEHRTVTASVVQPITADSLQYLFGHDAYKKCLELLEKAVMYGGVEAARRLLEAKAELEQRGDGTA